MENLSSMDMIINLIDGIMYEVATTELEQDNILTLWAGHNITFRNIFVLAGSVHSKIEIMCDDGENK